MSERLCKTDDVKVYLTILPDCRPASLRTDIKCVHPDNPDTPFMLPLAMIEIGDFIKLFRWKALDLGLGWFK